jgi:hypothetical protein
MANHKSPAKTIRSHRRLIEFLKSKTTTPSVEKRSPSICPQMTISIPPEQPKLTTIKLEQIDIKPNKIYHPTILNACDTMFKKHPDQLSQEEIHQFNYYRNWKSEIGDPIEANPIYLHIGGLRKCLICANLT